MVGQNSRAVAVKMLRRRFDALVPLDIQFRSSPFGELPTTEQALCRQLIDGVLRNLALLDWKLQKAAHRPLRRVDPVLLWILRVGACQIDFLRVPDHASVNESVRLCSILGRGFGRSFVNAVLRQYVRLSAEPPEGNSAEELALRFSHPGWVVARWLRRYGVTATRGILEANNRLPDSIVWVNRAKIELKDFCRRLDADQIPHVVLGDPPNCIRLEARGFVRHPLYRSGNCFFMDPSSQRVAGLVETGGSGTIADLCAAPGGKSFLTATRMNPGDRLVCCDIGYRRLREMRDRSEQLGISNLWLVQADCETGVPLGRGIMSLLVDVPCSGLGTLRSNPDLRWFLQEQDLAAWSRRQIGILKQAFAVLGRGGALVYATCSTEPEENEEVVGSLLQAEDTAELDGDYFRTLPGEALGDGFFAARIRRR